MKRFWLIAGIFCTWGPVALHGFYDAPRCYQELPTQFFTMEVLYPALALHEVFQSQWQPILTKLQERSREVPRTLRERASRLPRNPLDSPFQKKEAEELLKKVLFEIFDNTLRESNLTHSSDISDMFEDIWRKQEHLLNKCLP